MKEFYKKFGTLTLATLMSFSATGILSSCGQTNAPETDPDEIPTPTPTPTPGDTEEKITVATVVNEYFANKDFSSEFNSSLTKVASKKVSANDIKSVTLKSFEKGTSGKVVLNVTYKDELNMEADELTYTGDTTKFSDFYDI